MYYLPQGALENTFLVSPLTGQSNSHADFDFLDFEFWNLKFVFWRFSTWVIPFVLPTVGKPSDISPAYGG